MPKDLAVLLGLALGLGGLIHFVIGLVEWAQDRRLVREGLEATGRVVEEVNYPDTESVQTGYYRYIARYVVEGSVHHVTSRFSGGRGLYKDREVAILFDPRNPGRARFKLDRGLLGGVLGPAFFVLAMLGLFLYGIG